MCSVGFNSQFGMNVKQYQQMQKMRFGSGVRQLQQGQQFNMNTSLFTSGKANMFAQNSQTQSLYFNGVQYNNQYEMLNNVGTKDKSENDYSLKENFKSLMKEAGSEIKSFANTIGKGIKSFAGKVSNGVKNLFNKLTGKNGAQKSGNVDKALGDMQNAQDKATLKQAIDGANQENQAVGKQMQTDTKNLKAAETQENQAQQAADKAQQGLDTANKGLNEANKEQDAAKTEVQKAEDGLKTAQGNVANAQQALDAAKAAATTENPNSAAISKAEADLAAAKKEEAAAQSALDEAKQKETKAEENVAKSEEQLKTAEQQNSDAQTKVKDAEAKTQQAETQVQSTEQQGQQISEGIEQGEQRLEQMDTAQTGENSSSIAQDGTGQVESNTTSMPLDSGQSSNIYEKNGQYYVNGFQTDKNMYEAAQNMDQNVVNAGFSPGSTADVYVNGQDDPQTFTVQNGKYMVNGQEVDSTTFMNEYNKAKSNQEDGSGNDIHLINDDYSKYNKSSSKDNDSSMKTSSRESLRSSRPAADESGNGQVDQNLKARNQARDKAEWDAYVASRNAKK